MDKEKTTEVQPSQERIVLTDPSDTIVLKQLTLDDAVDYFTFIDNDRPHFSQHGDDTAKKYPDLESVQDRITQPNPDEYRFGVWEDGQMVGFIRLKRNKQGDFETGSLVASQQAGKNYAQRARQIILGFAFETLGVEKVVSLITIGNEPSRKSVEKSGYSFVKEENDTWVFEITKEEFEAREKQ